MRGSSSAGVAGKAELPVWHVVADEAELLLEGLRWLGLGLGLGLGLAVGLRLGLGLGLGLGFGLGLGLRFGCLG